MSRVYRITFKGTHYNGTLIEPSLHYKTDVPAGGDEPDPNDVAQGAWATIHSALVAASPNDVHFSEVSARQMVLPPEIGAAGSYTPPDAAGGITPDEQVPLAVVPVINLHSNVASRSGRGWFHLASPRKSTYITQSQWTTTYLTLLQAVADAATESFELGSVIITNCVPVVYSRTRHVRAEDPFAFDVVSATVQPQCRWLRSRLSSP